RAEPELRRSARDSPTLEEYRRRFPDDRAAVDAAFGIADRGDSPPPGPPPTAAHSLLLGILALQNNFIDREALLAAFNAWVMDKSRPLGQILLDRGALSAARHAVLLKLVGHHLDQHSHDPERSLAVLPAMPSSPPQLAPVP